MSIESNKAVVLRFFEAEGRWAEEWGVEDRLAMPRQTGGLAPAMT